MIKVYAEGIALFLLVTAETIGEGSEQLVWIVLALALGYRLLDIFRGLHFRIMKARENGRLKEAINVSRSLSAEGT